MDDENKEHQVKDGLIRCVEISTNLNKVLAEELLRLKTENDRLQKENDLLSHRLQGLLK